MSSSKPFTLSKDWGVHYREAFHPFILSSSSYLEGCENITYDQGLSTQVKAIFACLALISMISAVFVALSIFYHPKLRIHPAKLIGYMCICEAIAGFNSLIFAVNPIDVICYFGFHYLFSLTVYFDLSSADLTKSMNVLCKSNAVSIQFFQLLSLAFNFCLCHDLIATLKNPFYPGKRRMKFYFWGSIIIVTVLTYFSRGNYYGSCDDTTTNSTAVATTSNTYDSTDVLEVIRNLISAFSLTVYILMALYSCVYAYRRLTRPGMSAEIRIVFIRKHIAYVTAYIIIWTFYLASTYYNIYLSSLTTEEQNDPSRQNIKQIAESLSMITAMTTGLILAIIRTREPYFKFLIRKQWYEWFGILMDEKETMHSQQYINDTLATFLTSSLNVELVHVILISIGRSSGTVRPYNTYRDRDFIVRKEHQIDSIKIKDPEKWQVAKLPDFLIKEYDMKPSNKETLTRDQAPQNSTMYSSNSNIVQGMPYDPFEDDRLVINEDIYIKEYAPDCFAYLRELDGINSNVIQESLSTDKNRDMVFKAGESQGKSGSFFFFSHDKKFIIKTMTSSDLSTFKRLFKEYFRQIHYRKDSLLARIYGIYTVKMEEIDPVSLVLMGNTKDSNDKMIEHVFDLKGSFVNREVRAAKGQKLKNTATLKDLNLLNLCKSKILLRFKREDREKILTQLDLDVRVLESHNIMDYSLLFAIERNPDFDKYGGGQTQYSYNSKEEDDNPHAMTIRQKFNATKANRHRYLSQSGRYIYHLAIIDYLQDYNIEKIFESNFKKIIHKQGAQISAIEPKGYASRYLKFMRDRVIINQKDGQKQGSEILKRYATKKN